MHFSRLGWGLSILLILAGCGNGGQARPDGGGDDFDTGPDPFTQPESGSGNDSGGGGTPDSGTRKSIRLSSGTAPSSFKPDCDSSSVEKARKSNPLLPGMNLAQQVCTQQGTSFGYAAGAGLLTLKNNTATVACFDAATVQSFDVTLQQLKDQLPTEQQADVLFSSYGGRITADMYCQKKNGAWTGLGPYAADGDATSGKVVCLKNHGTRMEASLPACDPTMICHADGIDCANAISYYCKGKGYATGYGMFGWNPNTMKGAILCLNEE